MAESHSWARLVAEEIHKFYMLVEEYLADEYVDEWMEAHDPNAGELLSVEMHLHALQRLRERRKDYPQDAHISLHEFFRTMSPEDFGEDFWYHRDPMLSNKAQQLVQKNDNGLPLYRPVRVARRLLDAYGDNWVDLPDEDFKEAWDWNTLVDQDDRPKISWET